MPEDIGANISAGTAEAVEPAPPTAEDQEAALARLTEFVATPGELKMITDEHDCQGTPRWDPATQARGTADSPARLDFDRAKCAGYRYTLFDPRHFVLHDVTAFEEHPAHPDRLVGLTVEGDKIIGYPVALLKRLTEHDWYPATAGMADDERAKLADVLVAKLIGKIE